MSSRTALYRFYDEDDRLLYVGITDDLDTRWTSHAGKKHWWPNVARKAVEWHDNRISAAKAERDAIIGESPLYNVVHSPEYVRTRVKIKVQRPHGPAPAARWHAEVREELSRQGKSKTWLSEASGVSRAAMNNWAKQPRTPQAATVLAVADALGIEHEKALRLAGLTDAAPLPLDTGVTDLSAVPTDALVDQLHRIGDELRRRISD